MDNEITTFFVGILLTLAFTMPFTLFDDTVSIDFINHGIVRCEDNGGLRNIQIDGIFGQSGKIYCWNGAEFHVDEMVALLKGRK